MVEPKAFKIKKEISPLKAALVALGLHVFVVVFSWPFLRESDSGVEVEKLIPIHLGFGPAKSSGSSPGTAPQKLITTSTNSPTRIAPTATSDLGDEAPKASGVAMGSGTGAGTGSGNGSGAGNGSESRFEESIVNFEEATYPIIALKRGIEGSLKVRLKISAEGIPVEIVVLKSSQHTILDEAALKVIPKWRFQKRTGQDFYYVEKTFVFKIKN